MCPREFSLGDPLPCPRPQTPGLLRNLGPTFPLSQAEQGGSGASEGDFGLVLLGPWNG